MKNEDSSEDIVFRSQPEGSKSKGMLIGMICFAILAIGGIGFGVWAMMDGNDKVAKKDEQISDLNSQLAEKEAMVGDETIGDENIAHANPIIKSTDPTEEYTLYLHSLSPGQVEGADVVDIKAKNGVVEECKLGKLGVTSGTNTLGTITPVGDCDISGLEGEIFKIVEFGSGQDHSNTRIGFIMTDGSVKYTLPIQEAVSNNDFGIKGNLGIDGEVSDVLDASIYEVELYTGYVSSIFILKDGSFVKFDESMIQ